MVYESCSQLFDSLFPLLVSLLTSSASGTSHTTKSCGASTVQTSFDSRIFSTRPGRGAAPPTTQTLCGRASRLAPPKRRALRSRSMPACAASPPIATPLALSCAQCAHRSRRTTSQVSACLFLFCLSSSFLSLWHTPSFACAHIIFVSFDLLSRALPCQLRRRPLRPLRLSTGAAVGTAAAVAAAAAATGGTTAMPRQSRRVERARALAPQHSRRTSSRAEVRAEAPTRGWRSIDGSAPRAPAPRSYARPCSRAAQCSTRRQRGH